MESIVNTLNEYVWSNALVFLILAVGIIFTVATRFFQVRHLKDMIKLMFAGGDSKAGISSLQAVSMSIGSRAGIGNIAGVATAITLGGPGALFWIWVMAIFSSATSFIEVTLSQVYKSKQDGQYRGGTPYYIGKGLNMRWYGVIFAVITMISMSILVPGIQVNTIALSAEEAFGIDQFWTGLFLVTILAIVIFGGVKRIATTAQVLVPFLTIGYLIVCGIVIAANISEFGAVFTLIFSSALSFDSTFGGIVGAAIAWGIQRGAFSNAAGFGSETFESGAAEVSHPAKQGFVQALSVYIDTLIICSATGLMILFSGTYNVLHPDGGSIVNNIGEREAGSINSQLAVESVLPGFGGPFIAIAIFFFAFTSLITYAYKSETSLAYINSNKEKQIKWPLTVLKIVFLGFVFYSSTNSASLAWAMGDLGFGTMTWLNIIAILFLAKPALKVLRDYEAQKKAGLDPVFDPVKVGIKGADFWEHEYQYDGDSKNVIKVESITKRKYILKNQLVELTQTIKK